MKVAAIQTRVSADIGSSVPAALALVDQAAQEGAKFVVLPEYFDSHGDMSVHKAAAMAFPNWIIQSFQAKAREHGIWILAGSIHELRASGTKYRNTSVLIAPDEEIAGSYSKIHLFDAPEFDIHESSACEPGEGAVVLPVDGVPVGFSICYDLRFPELYRALSAKGAKVICVPAAFLYSTGELIWEPLLRARAIENQAYVIAANQTGGDLRCYGRSMIVAPDGKIIASLGSDETGFCIADVDVKLVDSIRSAVPALTHRRPDILS